MGTFPKSPVPTPHPNWSQDEVWNWIQNKIRAGDYSSITDWLQSANNYKEEKSHTDLMCQAVIDFCTNCQRHQEETEAAWESFQRAVNQEKALGENLSTLLKAFLFEEERSSAIHPSKLKRQEGSSFPTYVQPQSGDIQPGIWQRVQHFLNPGQTAPNLENPDSKLSSPPNDSNIIEIAGEESPNPQLPEKPPEIAHETFPQMSDISRGMTLLAPPDKTEPMKKFEGIPSLMIYSLGFFHVYQDDIPVIEWSNNKSASLFKYLLTHREEKIAKEVLMDLFWPDAAPDAARNNLNVTVYNLRKTLRNGYHEFSHILFQDGFYMLNPEMVIWVDAEEFEQNILTAEEYERNGRFEEAIQHYHAAEALYQGEFLSEDRYEDWPIPKRQYLQELYLDALDKLSNHYFNNGELTLSMRLCRQILTIDSCREEAHRQLMLGYYQLGQPYLALRQFHQCTEYLQEELNIAPSVDTVQILKQIRNHEIIEMELN